MQHWLYNWAAGSLQALTHTGADLLDILIVAILIYQLMMLAKGTRAWQIILGLLIFVAILLLSSWLRLTALQWLLQQMFLLGPVAIVILFYPELRHALEEVGRLGYWGKGFSGLQKEDLSAMIGQIVTAADTFSERKIGALIVLERETGLTEYIDNGTMVNAIVSSELLGTLFYPGTPLHDGAVIIRRDRIMAAGCTLPLSESRDIGTTVHTRHKAALGITEQSDSVAVIVSEETGIISVAFRGKRVPGLRGDDLRERLIKEYLGRERPSLRRRRGMSRPGPVAPSNKSERTAVSFSNFMPTLVAATTALTKPNQKPPTPSADTSVTDVSPSDPSSAEAHP